MTFKSWAAAGASCLAIAALAAASANPATANNNRYAGMITLGYSFTDLDLQNHNSDNTDINTFIGSGSVVYNVEGNYFAQANFAFGSYSPDDNSSSHHHHDDNGSNTFDTWTAGGSFFWRDSMVGLLGIDVGYQSAQLSSQSGDGYRVGLRGEYYLNDRWTIGAAAGWEQLDFDNSGDDHHHGHHDMQLGLIDGWYANAQIKYYLNERTSLSLNGNYFTFDQDDNGHHHHHHGDNSDDNQWSVGLEGEYLVSRETPVSIYGGVRYGEFDNLDTGHHHDDNGDPTQWTAYIGVKFRFGNDGAPLVGQDRSGAVAPTTTGFVEPFQM